MYHAIALTKKAIGVGPGLSELRRIPTSTSFVNKDKKETRVRKAG
jgi:hypothetical protein